MTFRTDVLKTLGFAADFQNDDFCQNILKMQYNLDVEKIFEKFEIEQKNESYNFSDIECIKRLYALIVLELQQTGWFYKFPIMDENDVEKLELPYLLVNCYSFNKLSNHLTSCKDNKHSYIAAKTLIDYHIDKACEESYFRKKISFSLNSTLFDKLYIQPCNGKPIKFINLGDYNRILYHHINSCKTNPFIERAQYWSQPPISLPLYQLLKSDSESNSYTPTETGDSLQFPSNEIRFTKQRLNTCHLQTCNFYKHLEELLDKNTKKSSHKNDELKEKSNISLPLFYSYIFLSERMLPICTTIDNILHIPYQLLHNPYISLNVSEVADILRYISFLPNIFLQQHIIQLLFDSLQSHRNFSYSSSASDDEKYMFKSNWISQTRYNLIRISSFYYPVLESCFYLLLKKYCHCINAEMNNFIENLFANDKLFSQNDLFYGLKKNVKNFTTTPTHLYTPEHFKIINEFWSTSGDGISTISKYCTAKSLDFRSKQIRGYQYPEFFRYCMNPDLYEIENNYFENWIQ